MIVFGIDPGRTCGWALLDVTTSRPRWIDSGTGEVDDMHEIVIRLGDARTIGPIDLVVIERPVGKMIAGYRDSHVIDTAFVAGLLLGRLQDSGTFEVTTISPQQWRASLVGAFRAGDVDKRVKAALEMTVDGFPKRSSVHERDAMGAAVVGSRVLRMRGARRTA